MGDGEKDEFKRVLLEGNPFFLGLTMVVSLLHTVFDALAFKNDIGFWRNKKNVEGLSIRTIAINCFCQVLPAPTSGICEHRKWDPDSFRAGVHAHLGRTASCPMVSLPPLSFWGFRL